MHQGSETHVPTVPGTLQTQQQTLLGKPSKQQACPSPAGRARPRLELLPLRSSLPEGRVLYGRLSPSSSSPMRQHMPSAPGKPTWLIPPRLFLAGKPHASGSWVKLIVSPHASSPTHYPRSPELVLDNRRSPGRGSAPAPRAHSSVPTGPSPA